MCDIREPSARQATVRKGYELYVAFRLALSRARDSGREHHVGEVSQATCVQVAQRVRVGRFLANA